MSDKFTVRSRLSDYEVDFVDDFRNAIDDSAKDNAFLIVDKKIDELYSKDINKIFRKDHIISIQSTEDSKTLEKCDSIIKELVEKNIRKNSVLFAVGGGVIEDIAGFISTILFRGIDWIFCPTTLLAQADSCIGSKSSINLGQYKNLLGSFYPPVRIIINPEFLKTLPQEEIRSGIGEMLHFYLIAGKTDLALELTTNYDELLEAPKKFKKFILTSLKIKKSVIEIDELDKGKRNIFNYGHTFGHALETVSSYDINHGQAVTMGMDIANYVSMRLGYIQEETFEYMHGILSGNLPAFRLLPKQNEAYFTALSKDKKNSKNNLGCILTRGPGSMFKVQLPFSKDLKDNIMSYFDACFEDKGKK